MSSASAYGRAWDPANDQIPDEFFSLPVYDSWPNAWPEDPSSVRAQFGVHNPFFQTGKAWLGLVPGKARLAGFWQPDLEFAGQKVAYFGYWETVDEMGPNAELFQELTDWAKSLGANALVGPVNFSTFGQYRIRLAGKLEDDVMAGEPFNPPYYQKLLEDLGLKASMRYESIFMALDEGLLSFLRKKTMDGQHSAYQEFKFLTLDEETWQRRLPEFHELTMALFQGAAGFKPISFEAFKAIYGPIVGKRQCPHSTLFMTTQDDRIMGYILSFPNYGSVIRRDVQPSPLSPAELSFQKAFPQMKAPVDIMKTLGIHPEFRGRGLQHILIAEALLRGEKVGYRTACYALMREGNPSNSLYPDLPLERRIYSLFAKSLGGT